MKNTPNVLKRLLTGNPLSWQCGLALLSALLLILSFPPFEVTHLIWIALLPLLFTLGSGVTRKRAFLLGWLTGLAWTYFCDSWIAHSMVFYGQFATALAYAICGLFAGILAVFTGLFALGVNQAVRTFGWPGFGAVPFLWVGSEWLRQALTGVTWNSLGISQVGNFAVARIARFGGVYLVTAEILAVTSVIVLATRLRNRATGRTAVALGMTAFLLYFMPGSSSPISGAAGALVSIVGIQPNLAPETADDPGRQAAALEESIRLTREAIARSPEKRVDLTVWAESPLALFHDHDPALRAKLGSLAQETGSYLVLNTVAREGSRYFNSINIIPPDSTELAAAKLPELKRYDKIRLVPFGEYVPYRSLLGGFVPAITGDFSPGGEAVVNLLRLETRRAALVTAESASIDPSIERTTNFIRLGGFICYEAAYPDLVRRFVRDGATLLVNVSNDTWFGNTAGARQHLAHARMRAVETDRDIIRATNSGISALITAEGTVIDALPQFISGSQFWQAQARRNVTTYVRYGDWFALSATGLSLLLIVGSIIIDRRRRRQSGAV
ncbi:MAG: apolipoprotein N-acyltransferase [Blastocatellia bacterium]